MSEDKQADFSDKLMATVKEDRMMEKQLKAMSQLKKLADKKKSSYYQGDFEDGMTLSSQSIDMTKEYSILAEGNSYATKNKMSGVYNLIGNTLEADQIDLLDLNTVQASVNAHFKFLFLKKRFNEIRKSAPVAIDYDHDGFHVKDSTFETLDEVEKAIANKAFL